MFELIIDIVNDTSLMKNVDCGLHTCAVRLYTSWIHDAQIVQLAIYTISLNLSSKGRQTFSLFISYLIFIQG